MTENEPHENDPDLPHDDELDVEAPNESAPGHNPPEGEDAAEEQ